MSKEATIVLIAAKTATLTFGGVLTYYSFRAYRRTRSSALRALSIGIGMLTVGALIGGIIHQILDVPLEVSVTIQSVFTAIGFLAMTYSLYADIGTSMKPDRPWSETDEY